MTAETRTVRHNEIVIPLPPGWEDGTQVVVVGELEDDFRPNVVVSHDPLHSPGETAREFGDRHLELLRQALGPDYTVLKEEDRDGTQQLGRHSGFLREHAFVANDVRLQQMQFYTVVGNTAFTLTFTHLATRFPERRDEILDLFGRVDLGGPARG